MSWNPFSSAQSNWAQQTAHTACQWASDNVGLSDAVQKTCESMGTNGFKFGEFIVTQGAQLAVQAGQAMSNTAVRAATNPTEFFNDPIVVASTAAAASTQFITNNVPIRAISDKVYQVLATGLAGVTAHSMATEGMNPSNAFLAGVLVLNQGYRTFKQWQAEKAAKKALEKAQELAAKALDLEKEKADQAEQQRLADEEREKQKEEEAIPPVVRMLTRVYATQDSSVSTSEPSTPIASTSAPAQMNHLATLFTNRGFEGFRGVAAPDAPARLNNVQQIPKSSAEPLSPYSIKGAIAPKFKKEEDTNN